MQTGGSIWKRHRLCENAGEMTLILYEEVGDPLDYAPWLPLSEFYDNNGDRREPFLAPGRA